MSQLKTKNGIRCDVCGTTHTEKFIYYDCSCKLFSIDFTSRPPKRQELDIAMYPSVRTFDMCSMCYGKYRKLILDNVGSAQQSKLKDDFSDKFYDKTQYLSMQLTRVDVDKDRKGDEVNSNVDIDMNVAGESLKEFLSLIKNQKSKKEKEVDEWTTGA